MDPISLEDLALLDVLKRIDQHIELTRDDSEIRKRMVESGLIEDDRNGLRLTAAGIELCKSLQHRVAADAQAEKVLQERADGESVENGAGDAAGGLTARSRAHRFRRVPAAFHGGRGLRGTGEGRWRAW